MLRGLVLDFLGQFGLRGEFGRASLPLWWGGLRSVPSTTQGGLCLGWCFPTQRVSIEGWKKAKKGMRKLGQVQSVSLGPNGPTSHWTGQARGNEEGSLGRAHPRDTPLPNAWPKAGLR